MSVEVYILVFVAWFLGGFANGVSGMGAAMVALPISTSFLPMETAVPASCLVVCLVAVYVAFMYRAHCRLVLTTSMLVGCVPGIIAGVLILKAVPGHWLQGGLGLLLLGYVVWQLWYIPSGTARFDSFTCGCLAGFGSGFANAAISFSGPPVAIYALINKWDKDTTRGTLGFFFFVIAVATCMAQGLAGMFTPDTVKVALYGLPGAALGLLCSIPLARRIPERQFKLVLLALIVLASLLCLYRAGKTLF